MPILKDCELWFAKVDPKRPNAKFNKKNPSWELQLRTSSKEQKKEWEEMKLSVKPIIPDDAPPYWRVNLKKKSIKADGAASSFVKVQDKKLNDMDPNSIGNGSVGNVRIFQYEFTKEAANGGGVGIATVLMGIQVTKHIKYTPKMRDDDFEEEEGDTEVFEPSGEPEGDSTQPKTAGKSVVDNQY